MKIALIGNQNTGKTTLYNALTGANRHAGNFPGVTVDVGEGKFDNNSIFDLPGVYSLTPYSADERVTLDFLLNVRPDCILNIVDATNLSRNLYLTYELLETQIPIIVALNMMDEVKRNGTEIDIHVLKQELNAEVIPISASKGEGIKELKEAMRNTIIRRCDEHALDIVKASAEEVEEKRVEKIVNDRYAKIERTVKNAITKVGENKALRISEKVDKILTNRYLAIPIFIAVMAAVFFVTFGLVGKKLTNIFTWFLSKSGEGLSDLLVSMEVSEWLRSLVVDGLYSGISSVLSFLPTILILFLCLSLIEDTGYMARVAFVADKLLSKIGLNGRAIVPLLIGYGCSVPAYMATRTLTARDRKFASALIPFMSCSAKIPVYAVFVSAFFAENRALIMIVLYLTGLLFATLTAVVLGKTVFKGGSTPFFIELPPYRMPSPKTVALCLWDKAKGFVTKAFTIILLASLVVWLMRSFDISFNRTVNADTSILASIGKLLAPIFKPLGFGDWRAVTAIITGLTAKEAIISTLAVLLNVSETALPNVLGAVFTPLSAFSFLLFVSLYMPCVAAFSAVKKENGLKFALLSMAFQTLVGYVISFCVYNIGGLFL